MAPLPHIVTALSQYVLLTFLLNWAKQSKEVKGKCQHFKWCTSCYPTAFYLACSHIYNARYIQYSKIYWSIKIVVAWKHHQPGWWWFPMQFLVYGRTTKILKLWHSLLDIWKKLFPRINYFFMQSRTGNEFYVAGTGDKWIREDNLSALGIKGQIHALKVMGNIHLDY